MNSFSNKKLSNHSFRVTPQEQYLKYLFNSEAIPFVSQKSFPLPDRSYIVDFFIADRLLLECSQTSASAYQVAKTITVADGSFQLQILFSQLFFPLFQFQFRFFFARYIDQNCLPVTFFNVFSRLRAWSRI